MRVEMDEDVVVSGLNSEAASTGLTATRPNLILWYSTLPRLHRQIPRNGVREPDMPLHFYDRQRKVATRPLPMRHIK